MGLDIVEYVVRVEDLFQVNLPNAELREIRTPRDLAEVIRRQLPTNNLSRAGCLSQRAFYRLRNALLETQPGLSRQELRPTAECSSISGSTGRPVQWRAVGKKLGVRLKNNFSEPGRLGRLLGLRPTKLGALAERLVAEKPSTLRGFDEGWTDAQILEILLRVVEREQGLEPHRYNADSEFVHDMRMD